MLLLTEMVMDRSCCAILTTATVQPRPTLRREAAPSTVMAPVCTLLLPS